MKLSFLVLLVLSGMAFADNFDSSEQSMLMDRLSRLKIDDQGKVVDSASGEPVSDRLSGLKFDDQGNVIVSSTAQAVLFFPNVNTAYVVGDHVRTLIQFEIKRQQSMHLDANVGEQFLGISLGKTLALGNISLLAGYGYDMDSSKGSFFAGVSHRTTLIFPGKLKTFLGYDVLEKRLRKGLAYPLYTKGQFSFDVIGSERLFGEHNFLGLSLTRDMFKNTGSHHSSFSVGGFLGYDFDSTRSNRLGSGITALIRF